MQLSVPCQIDDAEKGAPGECHWLVISRSAAWLIGVVAVVLTASVLLYAAWLGAKVPALWADLATLDAKVNYLGKLTDSRIGVGDRALEDKIATLKVEIDKLKHNNELIADKLLSLEHGQSRRKRR